MRTASRCGLSREDLAPAAARLWALTAQLVEDARTAEALNGILRGSLDAWLRDELGPALGKLARLHVAERTGVPIFVGLPLAGVLEELLDSLAGHLTLKKLVLKTAELGAAAADPLAAFLVSSPHSMYEVYLNGNPGLGAHAAPIFEAAAANAAAGRNLSALSLAGCGVADGAAVALEQLLLGGELELVELNLEGHALSADMVGRLRRANARRHVQTLHL